MSTQMYSSTDYSNFLSSTASKKDQQVPTFQSTLDSGADPLPLLEEILTHEQNTCIQIRDTCTLMAQSVRDVLGSACPQGGYVQVMQDKLGQLEQAVNSLECTIKRKSVFPNEFLDTASQRWFEKRLSCKSRKRRLRNFKRKDAPAGRVASQDSPPNTPSGYSFLPFEDSRPPTSSAPSSPPRVPSPHSPPLVQQLPTLTIPSNSPNNSPRGRNSARGSPSACVPSTPSYSPRSPLPRQGSDSYLDEKGKSMSISNIIN
eukprot:Phypoly_transcript_13610.p1 GENE.Phypoly_transcript_13610~~Phypoly_transcript_13610.p1  ORF type:complete len:259 (-),score=51.11 Phypoly_transcript_13610:94-870(-)